MALYRFIKSPSSTIFINLRTTTQPDSEKLGAMAKTNPKSKHTQKKSPRNFEELVDHLKHTIGNFMKSQRGPEDLEKLREACHTATEFAANPPHSNHQRTVLKQAKDIFQQQFNKINEASFHVRLDTLLLGVITAVKDMEIPGSRSLRVSTEQPMSFQPFRYMDEDYRLQGIADYALWYGRKRDIDTNLVVLEAKANSDSAGIPQLLLYMAMVHKKRRSMGKNNCTVYGIVACPDDFDFIQIDDEGVYSVCRIQCWKQDFGPCIPLLTSIIAKAATLSPSNSEELDPVVDEMEIEQI
ncbi:hypothetical protein N7481_002327 [Penicillium waksmanii]|uniref:uncharacterized protein n=1 Tax=Penicillium waksmanii TaxID=69791 RepID=UPI002549227B|nr:uncharacterized protein N7481_002327 [Penicillium waksmanii]KAJ5995350.1 hypothetical protein N7481_002327 [Penicillium waksmanii]